MKLTPITNYSAAPADDKFAEIGIADKAGEHIGWGIVGQPKDGVLIQVFGGTGIDVTGYNEGDYWGPEFEGPDDWGIVPIYRKADGTLFPEGAEQYPYRA